MAVRSCHQRPKRLLNQGLALRVERAGGFVQDEDRRVLENRPRNRHALPLPARELHATLADQRLVTRRQGLDELGRMRETRGMAHLGIGRVWSGRRGCCRQWTDETSTDPAARSRSPGAARPAGRGRSVVRPRRYLAAFDIDETQQQPRQAWSCPRRSGRPAPPWRPARSSAKSARRASGCPGE